MDKAGCAESGCRPAGKMQKETPESGDGYFHPRLTEGGDRGRNCAGEKA